MNGFIGFIFKVNLAIVPLMAVWVVGFEVWVANSIMSLQRDAAVASETMIQHTVNSDHHMPFSQKVRTFVMRDEYQRSQASVEQSVDQLRSRMTEEMAAMRADMAAMEKKVDRLLERP